MTNLARSQLSSVGTSKKYNNVEGSQVHHIRPLWAGGEENKAENLIPIKDGHTGKGSLHSW